MLRPDDVQVTSSGATGEDIRLSPAARDLLPVTIEVKCQEALNVWAALQQADQHAQGTSYIPLLAFKRNNTDLFVALRAEHFLSLIGRSE